MTTAEYIEFTATTDRYPPAASEVAYVTLITSEAGEVAGAYNKYIRGDYGHDTYIDKLKLELGDLLYPIARMCQQHCWTFEELMEANAEKLRGRLARGTIRGSGDDR